MGFFAKFPSPVQTMVQPYQMLLVNIWKKQFSVRCTSPKKVTVSSETSVNRSNLRPSAPAGRTTFVPNSGPQFG
jgi:hypothetical protein